MKADYAFERHVLPRHLQDAASAEAVADGGDFFWIDHRLLFEFIKRRLGALRTKLRIFLHLARQFSGLIRIIGGLAFAVHIDGKTDVSKLRQLLGALVRVVVVSPPFRKYQHARTLGVTGIIVSQITDHALIAGLVIDLLRL